MTPQVYFLLRIPIGTTAMDLIVKGDFTPKMLKHIRRLVDLAIAFAVEDEAKARAAAPNPIWPVQHADRNG